MVGIAGFNKENDCLVKVDMKDKGGLIIRISSKLKRLFGKCMTKAVINAAQEMKIENAVIEVEDFGALDFVIKARVKTAVKRAQEAR